MCRDQLVCLLPRLSIQSTLFSRNSSKFGLKHQHNGPAYPYQTSRIFMVALAAILTDYTPKIMGEVSCILEEILCHCVDVV